MGIDYLQRIEEDTMLMVLLFFFFIFSIQLINAISCVRWAENRFVHGTFHNAFKKLCILNKSDENATFSSYCSNELLWFTILNTQAQILGKFH